MHFLKRKYKPGLKNYRTEALSDSIFGFAITLLVLALAVPQLTTTQLQSGALLPELIKLWPKLVTYLISALIIIIFWIGHTILFHFVTKSDRTFIWFNSLFLIMIAFFPFPVGVLGQYHTDPIAAAFYGFTLTLTGIFYAAMWFYATTNRQLIDNKLTDKLIKKGNVIILLAPAVYFLGSVLAFLNLNITLLLYILLPIIYILPSPVDEFVDAATDE